MGKEYRNAMTSHLISNTEALQTLPFWTFMEYSTSSLPIPPCQKSGGVTESSNLLLVAGSPDSQAPSLGAFQVTSLTIPAVV